MNHKVIPYTQNNMYHNIALTIVINISSQRDLKNGLAYSTMSQLGYMVLSLGVGVCMNLQHPKSLVPFDEICIV